VSQGVEKMEENVKEPTYDFSYPEFYPTDYALWLPTPKKHTALFASIFSFTMFHVYRCV